MYIIYEMPREPCAAYWQIKVVCQKPTYYGISLTFD